MPCGQPRGSPSCLGNGLEDSECTEVTQKPSGLTRRSPGCLGDTQRNTRVCLEDCLKNRYDSLDRQDACVLSRRSLIYVMMDCLENREDPQACPEDSQDLLELSLGSLRSCSPISKVFVCQRDTFTTHSSQHSRKVQLKPIFLTYSSLVQLYYLSPGKCRATVPWNNRVSFW